MIKAHSNSRNQPDEISEVLDCQIYALRYYFQELKDICLGRHSPDLVGVSRYYLTLDPQVVVDFEESDTKFYLEEKRKFFMEKKIVYVPIFLKQILTKEQFASLVQTEREALVRGYRETLEDQALISAQDPKDRIFSELDVQDYVHRESLRRCAEKGLKGIAKTKHLPHVMKQVIAEVKEMQEKGQGLDAIMGRS